MALLKVYKGTKIIARLEIQLLGTPDVNRLVRIRKNLEDDLPETNKWLIEDNGVKYTILQPKKFKDSPRIIFVTYSNLKIKGVSYAKSKENEN